MFFSKSIDEKIDVWAKKGVDTLIKVLLTVGLLCFSWIGLAIYYFIIKDRL